MLMIVRDGFPYPNKKSWQTLLSRQTHKNIAFIGCVEFIKIFRALFKLILEGFIILPGLNDGSLNFLTRIRYLYFDIVQCQEIDQENIIIFLVLLFVGEEVS